MGLNGTAWKPIGPSPISGSSRLDNGLVTSIAVHPVNPSIVYLGTGGGGLWRTVDNGQHWQPLFDRQVSLNIGEASAVAIDPVDPDTVYAGISGRAFTGFASAAIDTTAGLGLYKSTDGGSTWIRLGSGFPAGNTGTANNFASDWLYSIVVDPANRQRLYLAARSGVYRSVDGGLNWTLGTNASGDAETLAVDLSSPVAARVLYAGIRGQGVMRSSDGGATWASVFGTATSVLGGASFTKVVVALAPPASPANAAGVQVVYVSVASATGPPFLPVGMFVTTDAGSTWAKQTATGIANANSTQRGYSFAFAVDPASPGDGANDTIYFGCTNQLRSTNSGGSFSTLSGLHADTHAWAFGPTGPTPTVVYVGTDGGFYTSADGGSTWTALNSGAIQSTLFYNVDSKPDATASVVVGALQDNGVQSTAGQPAPQWRARGGDGWNAVFDGAANTSVVYASDGVYIAAPATRVFRSSNDGASYPANITPWGTATDQGAYITSIATRPGTAGTVYVCGNQNLWQSLSSGDAGSWRIVDSRGGPGDIAVSPTNGNYVAHAVGRRVFLSTNALAPTVGGSAGVQFADISRNLPNRNVQRVAFDPIDPVVIYAVLGGFDGAGAGQQGHVFRTTVASTVWTDISPPVNVPMGAIALDAATVPTTIYVGTDLGVVCTVNLGRSWIVIDDIHLPTVPVTDLSFVPQAGVLRAATFGRGVFEFANPGHASINLSLADGLDFETVCPGQHTDLALEVVNVGAADLIVTSVFNSVGSADFTVLPYPRCPAIVQPGEQLDFVVRYTPGAPGGPPQAATIRVISNDPDAPIVDVLATGQPGRASAELVVPPHGSVCDVCAGGCADTPVVISNSGTCALVITDIACTPGSGFSVSTVLSYPLVVEAGGQITVAVRYAPTEQGPASTTLTMTSNDPDSPATVELHGFAPHGTLAVTGSACFGEVLFGQRLQQRLTFSNVGKCDLHVTEVGFKGCRCPGCETLLLVRNPFPATLHPGASLDLVLQYTATGGSPCTRCLKIESDDPDHPEVIVDVSAATKMTLNGALRGWLASNLHSLLTTVITPPCDEGTTGPHDDPC